VCKNRANDALQVKRMLDLCLRQEKGEKEKKDHFRFLDCDAFLQSCVTICLVAFGGVAITRAVSTSYNKSLLLRRFHRLRATPDFQKPENVYDIAAQVLNIVRFVKTSVKKNVIGNCIV
jgi:hypothetical protein